MNDKLSPEEWFERFPELKDSLETSRKHEEIRRTIFPIIDQDSDLWFMLSSFLMASAAIDRIVTFAQEMGMHELKANHARYFVQPHGYVSCAVDVDLATAALIGYPRTSDSRPKLSFQTAEVETCDRLKLILNSEAFVNIPSKIASSGCDGASYLIEANLEGVYYWKCHWVPKDQTFWEIQCIFNELIAKCGLYS